MQFGWLSGSEPMYDDIFPQIMSSEQAPRINTNQLKAEGSPEGANVVRLFSRAREDEGRFRDTSRARLRSVAREDRVAHAGGCSQLESIVHPLKRGKIKLNRIWKHIFSHGLKVPLIHEMWG